MKLPLLALMALALAGCTTPNERRVAELDRMHAAGQLPRGYWLAERSRLQAEDRAYSDARAQRMMGGGAFYRPAPGYGAPGNAYLDTINASRQQFSRPGSRLNPVHVEVRRAPYY